ncbi:MAG: metal ABC transporter permease [Oscillospiraceae bacterium]|nr:metal ABC transporter permease [Oscillospiraceae bacterium]
MSLLSKLFYYFEFPFVRYAFLVGVLIALCASLLGVTLVLKRFSFIGDGLSHVAFGALAIASVLGLSGNGSMAIVLPLTMIAAVIILKTGQNTKIRGDAAIGMLSVGALAFGYLIMNVFSASSNVSGDVCSTLFGSTSILTLSKSDVYLCIILSAGVIAFYILFYNRLFSVTFDESFASATGINTSLCNFIIALVTAAIIVLAMRLVGSLLISALVIFPAMSAMRVFKSFKSVSICAAGIALVCTGLGLIVSISAGTPAGATVVCADIIAFLIFSVLGKVLRR